LAILGLELFAAVADAREKLMPARGLMKNTQAQLMALSRDGITSPRLLGEIAANALYRLDTTLDPNDY